VREYEVTAGSEAGVKRIEFDFAVISISNPEIRPLLPVMPEHLNVPPPVDEQYLNEYMSYLLTPIKQTHEHYTYGERLAVGLDFAIDYYRKHPDGGTNRVCLEVAMPTDILNYQEEDSSTPCMRLIDTRLRDGKLSLFPYFRSWSLWNGFPANLAGLQMLCEYMAMEIGCETGPMIATSKGLNVRAYSWDTLKAMLQR